MDNIKIQQLSNVFYAHPFAKLAASTPPTAHHVDYHLLEFHYIWKMEPASINAQLDSIKISPIISALLVMQPAEAVTMAQGTIASAVATSAPLNITS